MSRGKYLSLEEARNSDEIEQFCKEHPSNGDDGEFERLLMAMTRRTSVADKTSKPDASVC